MSLCLPLNLEPGTFEPSYRFDVSCQGTVPEAVICFLESVSYEDAVRNAVSLGGDSDTLGCITGGMAEAFYGPVPDWIQRKVRTILPPDLLDIIDRFYAGFMNP
ncbi:MAG: ADP-ribosylglycohydrolase family protein [Thermodesulfobacteriota bacterium]